MIDKRQVIGFLARKPRSFRELSEAFALTSSERRALKRLLRSLVSEGLLTRNRRGLYGTFSESQFKTGYFQAHRDGYGFVILQEPNQRDIFVPSKGTMDAMDDDRVVVRIDDAKRRQGTIVKILERAHRRIVGVMDRNRSGYLVRPSDPKIAFDLYVSPKDTAGAEEGDRVVAEIKSYPEAGRPASAEIKVVLKRPNTLSEHISNLLEELDVQKGFPTKVHQQATGLRDSKNYEKRQDLRNLTTITIDGEQARDFDDAVSITKTDGGYRLWVHIADVSHFVPWNSPMDLEARQRGTSIYLPDRVIPMLPKELSEELCSLKPRQDRLTFTVEMEFRPDGEIIDRQFYLSVINSNERMTYKVVSEIIDNKKQWNQYEPIREDLISMHELAQTLRTKRKSRGSLDFDLPEPEVLLDMQGNPENIIKSERNSAHIIIEEFMIAANEAVASFVEEVDVPSIYRIHEYPDNDRIEEAFKFLKDSGLIRATAYKKAKNLHRFVATISGHPHEDLITKHLLKSLKQARYSTDNIGHFGLASEAYTHFTSPIRRYPDLIVHRVLKSILLKEDLPCDEGEFETLLSDIAFLSSKMEKKAEDVEWAALEITRCWFMETKRGETFEAQVVNITPYGLKVRLKDFYVEGFVHLTHMTDDFYRYNEKTYSLIGTRKRKTYKIGSPLTVRLESIDLEGREILFELV